MGLLHQLGHSGLDLRSGGVIQLPQAPRVALFRGDLGIPAEPADADRDPGPAAGAAGAGDKDGAGGDPLPPGVVQQLPPEAVGQALGIASPGRSRTPSPAASTVTCSSSWTGNPVEVNSLISR